MRTAGVAAMLLAIAGGVHASSSTNAPPRAEADLAFGFEGDLVAGEEFEAVLTVQANEVLHNASAQLMHLTGKLVIVDAPDRAARIPVGSHAFRWRLTATESHAAWIPYRLISDEGEREGSVHAYFGRSEGHPDLRQAVRGSPLAGSLDVSHDGANSVVHARYLLPVGEWRDVAEVAVKLRTNAGDVPESITAGPATGVVETSLVLPRQAGMEDLEVEVQVTLVGETTFFLDGRAEAFVDACNEGFTVHLDATGGLQPPCSERSTTVETGDQAASPGPSLAQPSAWALATGLVALALLLRRAQR